MVRIYAEEYIHIPVIARFMAWFGEVKDVQLLGYDHITLCYSIEVRFKCQASIDQLLLWPHPVFIDKKRVFLTESNLQRQISTFSTLGSQFTLYMPQKLRSSCLCVYRIPQTWQAYELYTLLNSVFRNSISTTIVSIDGIDGYKRGLVEFTSSLVALELLLASSTEFKGTKLYFFDHDLSNIYSLHPDTLIDFDVFPFRPTSRDATLISIPVHEPQPYQASSIMKID